MKFSKQKYKRFNFAALASVRILFPICVFLLFSVSAFAQSNILEADVSEPDPLGSPEVWKKISDKPHDVEAWTLYLGRSWESLTPNERVQIKLWQQPLFLAYIEAGKHLIKPKKEEPKDDFKDILAKPKVRKFMNELKEIMLAQPQEVDELKENLFENFLIIEDYYTEAFEEFGGEYTSYAEKYPDGGFSESKWIQEKDQELQSLKKQRLEEMQTEFLQAERKKMESGKGN